MQERKTSTSREDTSCDEAAAFFGLIILAGIINFIYNFIIYVVIPLLAIVFIFTVICWIMDNQNNTEYCSNQKKQQNINKYLTRGSKNKIKNLKLIPSSGGEKQIVIVLNLIENNRLRRANRA
jgi:hypothetical protein